MADLDATDPIKQVMARIEEKRKWRIGEDAVARILGLIHTVPNKRDTPLPGDPQGSFHFWFDGGTCTEMTGWWRYEFEDSVFADVGTCNPDVLSITIRFPDGRRVDIQQGGSRAA